MPNNLPPSTTETALKRRWRRATGGHWLARIISILLASVVWLAVLSEENIERTLSIPIVPYADRDNLMWIGDPPGDAVVRVQGKARSIWWLIYITPPEIRIPLSSLPSEGEVRLRLDMVELSQRADVKIVAILKPDILPVRVERFTNRIIPIKPQITIVPEDGFIVAGQPTPFPAGVEVSGNRTKLFEIDSVVTEPLTIKNSASPGTVRMKLAKIPGVKLGLSTVEVRYTVERLVEERIENIPVTVPNGWIVEPPWVTLKVSGPGSLLLELRKHVPKARLSQPITATDAVPVIELPAMVKMVSIIPQTVKVRRK